MKKLFCAILLALGAISAAMAGPPAKVGSKTFTESYILAELVAQNIEGQGQPVVRQFGMGGTGILFNSLKAGEIDLYPEYTGTVAEAILKRPELRSWQEISDALKPLDLVMTGPLGFDNTYALAVRRDVAARFGLSKISDLRRVAHDLKIGFSHEFITRADGFQALMKAYGLSLGENVKSMEHSLAYEAIRNNEIDLTDVYSTDAKIGRFDLVVLKDNLHFFPQYQAVLLARRDFAESQPATWRALKAKLEGNLNEKKMIELNAAVDIDKKSFSEAAALVLGPKTGVSSPEKISAIRAHILQRTREHLWLVGVSLFFAIFIGLPLGVLASRSIVLSQFILTLTSIFQTIPSLALLCFLIPIFGIGTRPALVALFLYGLLPVVLNTFVGIKNIDQKLIETARAMGMTAFQRLRIVEIPLASPNILAGIKTSAIIGIGTATLAALIGSGGYGVPIVTGLAINDVNTILTGAIPAALLALLTHFFFEILSKWVVPRGLR